ncbi:MAG: hypothetical protein NW208_17260 [Bryobacter sp.]|nr:hypothetical protein [Bryobacter sp.]
MDKQEFLNAIAGSDIEKRFAAWRSAGEQDASVVPALITLTENTDPGIAKAATEALTTMVHACGKSFADPRRAPLAKALNEKHTAHTLRLLSLIGGDPEVPQIAQSLSNPALAEEAIFALERIPGPASEKAMLAAYAKASPTFRPRLLYALGRRRVKAAEPLARRAMMDRTALGLAEAGNFAKGRIGLTPGPTFAPSRTQDLIRYAESALADGNKALALQLYASLLKRPEEHFQCAGLVGMGKIGTAEAAQSVYAKLKSPDRKVRLTAAQVWSRFV